MKNNWLTWYQEALDHAMCQHDVPPRKLGEAFERQAWLAWSGGRDNMEFVDEFIRDRRPEY